MMRITNGMMMTNTKSNINNNKVSVDNLNTRMSTQKKINKPSDNALIAIRALRLNDTMSQINQFYKNNIPDAESWMEVSETALKNMEDIMKDAYRLAVNGTNDTLTEDDRNTILTQLQSLSAQLYHEANSDYAGRTVFTGYKTNETVTFNNDYQASIAKYEIEEKLGYEKIESKSYYANSKTSGVPTAAAIANATNNGTSTSADISGIPSPLEIPLNRVRLGYKNQDSINEIQNSFSVETTAAKDDGTVTATAIIQTKVEGKTEAGGNTVDVNTQAVQWKSTSLGTTFTYQSDQGGGLSYAKLTDNMSNELYFKTNTGTDVNEIKDELDDYGIGDRSFNYIYLTNEMTGENIQMAYDSSKLTCKTQNSGTTNVFYDANGDEVYRVVADASLGQYYIKDRAGNEVWIDQTGDTITDIQKNKITSDTAGQTITIKNDDAKELFRAEFSDGDSYNLSDGTTATSKQVKVVTNDKSDSITTELVVETMTAAEFEEYLSAVALKEQVYSGSNPNFAGKTGDEIAEDYTNKLIYLADSGEIVIGNNLTQSLTSEKAGFTFNYDKVGFESSEVRPEMYYNCIDKTDSANPIQYTNYDDADGWIYQNIEYQVAANQTLSVNTQIANVLNSDTFRDLEEMTNVIQYCIEAHKSVKSIEEMLESPNYTSDSEQEYLRKALANAEKQAAYYDDMLHTTYSKQIGRFEEYNKKINLAITDSGSRGERLALTKNRMANQQTTFSELQSKNEDEDLSDITIDYTSAYQAYQASLQAAGKISDMSLMDYI